MIVVTSSGARNSRASMGKGVWEARAIEGNPNKETPDVDFTNAPPKAPPPRNNAVMHANSNDLPPAA